MTPSQIWKIKINGGREDIYTNSSSVGKKTTGLKTDFKKRSFFRIEIHDTLFKIQGSNNNDKSVT